MTNGKRQFIDGDEDGPIGRRFRDVYEMHVATLGPPGTLSLAQDTACRTIAGLTIAKEQMDALMSKGEPVRWETYQRTANSLMRQIKQLPKIKGLDAPAAAVPTVADLKARHAKP